MINREIAVFTRKENGFNCLNHGDMWLFNILFQGNENKECVFVSHSYKKNLNTNFKKYII